MRKGRRMDNNGLTLVELLIAITILAIITVPLLHAFVSSARVNRKAKQTQRLTTMGQDIMEGLKAYSIEELAYEFDYPTVSSCSAHPSGFQLISPSMLDSSSSKVMELAAGSGGVFSKIDATTTPSQSIKESGVAPNIEYEFDETKFDTHAPYYFAVTNISSEKATSGSYKADILITVNPRKYINDTDATALGYSGNVSNNKAQHNSDLMADLSSMDTTRDSFFLESGTQVNNAFNQLRSMGAVITSAKDMSKEIEVTVSDDSPNKKVVYKFTYKAGGYSVEFPTNPALSTLKYSTLDNVYLFYMPSYNTTGDVITYTNNTSDKKIGFTLVKRQILASDGLNPTYSVDDFYSLDTAERSYKCNVILNDSNNNTVFKTNVDSNLATLIKDPGNTYSSEDILKTSSDMTGVSITYNLGAATGERVSVAGKKKEDRIFDIVIDIYEPGTIEAAVSGGTALPADKHLVTVHGNMN